MQEPTGASVSSPFRLFESTGGFAQASHSSARTSPTEGTASSVISGEAIEGLWYSDPKIVHCTQDFKPIKSASGSRHKAFKNHLIGVARRAGALFRCAHRPGQQRASEQIAGKPGRR